MLTIALTGGIASGKSTVSDMFASLGVPVIDADYITHEILAQEHSQSSIIQQISSLLGNDILDDNGFIIRDVLAKKVFHKTQYLTALESILHPEIYRQIDERIKQYNEVGESYIIVVIPLLVETSDTSHFDRVVVVDCDNALQEQRALLRPNMTREKLQAVLNRQASREQRIQLADDIIENFSDLDNLQQQVQELHQSYISMNN